MRLSGSGSLENYGELIFEDFVNLRLGQEAKFEKMYIICFQTIILVCKPMTSKNTGWPFGRDAPKIESLKLWFKTSFPADKLLVSQVANQDKVIEFLIKNSSIHRTVVRMRLCHCQMALLVPDVSLMRYLIIQK